MKYEFLYFKLPVLFQTILVNVQGFRLFKRRFAGSSEALVQHYLNSDMNAVDAVKLRKFLLNAKRAPFWKRRFEEFGVELCGDFDPIKEIKKLPVLTKEEVRENWADIALLDTPKISKTVTSGSTGTALTVLHTIASERHQWAVWERDRRTHGVGVKVWMGWFGGKPIVPKDQKKPPYWRVCWPLKQVMFSIDHLDDHTASSYFNKVKDAKLSWLHGYPSQLTLFASLVKKYKLGFLPDMKLITVGSESLLPYQKQLLEDVFNVPVRQCYGLAEGVAAITEDKSGRFVINQDFSYVELLRFDGRDTSERRIVGTNYNNLAFPLIRYFTGDIATVGPEGDVLGIDGRVDDYICFSDGSRMGRLYQLFKSTKNVKEAQIYQPDVNSIVLRIVRSEGYSDSDEALILEDARERFRDKVGFKIEYLESIPKTRSGKLRLVVSDVDAQVGLQG